MEILNDLWLIVYLYFFKTDRETYFLYMVLEAKKINILPFVCIKISVNVFSPFRLVKHFTKPSLTPILTELYHKAMI